MFIFRVNQFIATEESPIPMMKIDESIQVIQTDKLKKLREKRDNEKVKACLAAINTIANGTENLMPAIVEAVESYCTLGEIAGELRKVFGEYK